MNNPHAHRLPDLVTEARTAAATIDHAWDRRALDWPLTRRSVVVDVGGYKGRWAYQIATRYRPRLYVFEPQPWAHATCQALLGDAATVLNYGLGDRDGMLPMGDWETDGCSFVKPGDGVGALREIGAAFAELKLKRIDLMLMNIEGYEYTLLPHMLSRGILPRRLMVQFHLFVDRAEQRMARIHASLAARGYREAWTYGAMLTAWER